MHIQRQRYLRIGRPKKIGFAERAVFSDLSQAIEYFVDHFGFVSIETGKPFNLYPLMPW